MTTTTTLRDKVIELAKTDARVFVDEFAEPFDAAETDWDSVAWDDAVLALRLADSDQEALWPVYIEALTKETERLCS